MALWVSVVVVAFFIEVQATPMMRSIIQPVGCQLEHGPSQFYLETWGNAIWQAVTSSSVDEKMKNLRDFSDTLFLGSEVQAFRA